MMHLKVDAKLDLTELQISDVDSLVNLLNCRLVYRNTLRIPHPYRSDHAEDWIAHNHQVFDDQGRHFNLAIRNTDGCLIGVVGVLGIVPPHIHRAEIGYWLGEAYWNRGIMTRVLPVFLGYAFQEFGLAKVTAHVFAGNRSSERVLEKCGFIKEGYLKMHYVKDGQPIDATAWGLIRSDA